MIYSDGTTDEMLEEHKFLKALNDDLKVEIANKSKQDAIINKSKKLYTYADAVKDIADIDALIKDVDVSTLKGQELRKYVSCCTRFNNIKTRFLSDSNLDESDFIIDRERGTITKRL